MKYTIPELTAIKKALYFYNSYYTKEYKQNGRTLPPEYDEGNVVNAEMKTRIMLGESEDFIKSIYGTSKI